MRNLLQLLADWIRSSRLFSDLAGNSQKRKQALCDRPLAVEQLEARILYSAAPVEAPAQDAEPAQDAPSAAEVTVAEPASASAPDDTGAAPSVPTGSESGEIAASQQVSLVDADSNSAALNQQVVETLAAQARQRWIDSGISAEQIAALDSVSYRIADVGGAHLGVAEGFTITIDDDAGGAGVDRWFIDATPDVDEEFSNFASSTRASAIFGTAASARFDLLSTLIHEQGHVLGLGDQYGARTDVMDGFLDVGSRRLPSAGQADGAVAGSVTGANYLTANIVRASTLADGSQSAGGNASEVALSADGRYAVFQSTASDLLGAGVDVNGIVDVFRKDLQTGEILLVSSDAFGVQSNGASGNASISGDGRFVVFESDASNLLGMGLGADGNAATDVFLKDLLTGALTLVSSDSAGLQTNGNSINASISSDGRFVAFDSIASNLLGTGPGADGNGVVDVFRKDLQTGQTVLASSDSTGAQSNGLSSKSSISASGRFVAFQSDAANLLGSGAGADGNGVRDVFVKDLLTGKTTLASVDASGVQGNAGSGLASISGDGRFVAFESTASTLLGSGPGADVNGVRDVFVKDLQTGEVLLVSSRAAIAQGNGASFAPSISADGRFVAFDTDADNFLGMGMGADGNATKDVFVKDLQTGELRLVHSDVTGFQGNGATSNAAISADGRFVAFQSDSTNLLGAGGDSNARRDIYVKGLAPFTQTYTTSVEFNGAGDLIIEDIDGADTNDRLFIELIDDKLHVSDTLATVGSSIVGATQVTTKSIVIDLTTFSGFSGLIVVRTLGGDDIITVGDVIDGSVRLTIEDGMGDDLISQIGDVVVAGDIDYASERIRLELGSTLASFAGDIELKANEFDTGTGSFTGLYASGAFLLANNGSITLSGRGGAVGSYNRGVQLLNTTVTTDGAMAITIDGTGGGTGIFNEGVAIGTGSSLNAADSGSVTVRGTGGDGTLYNRGVNIANGVAVSGFTDILLEGTGGNGTSLNAGVLLGNGFVLSITGAITVNGFGSGSGTTNTGVTLTQSVIQAVGGDVNVSGFGSVTGTSYNRGVTIVGGSIHGQNIGIFGSGGGSGVLNTGVSIASGAKIESNFATGAITVAGTGGNGTSSNEGVVISTASTEIRTIDGTLNIFGTGQGSLSFNRGINVAYATVEATGGGQVNLLGNASIAATGSSNEGTVLTYAKIMTNTGSLDVRGFGSRDGLSSNYGIRGLGAQITSQGGLITLFSEVGVAGSNTRGSSNIGLFLSISTVETMGNITLQGAGGTGTSSNMGLYLSASKILGGGTTNITGFAKPGTTGSSNYGSNLIGTTVTGAAISVFGFGGSGTSLNRGLNVSGGSMTASVSFLSLLGQASFVTTGTSNTGTHIYATALRAVGNLSIVGVGGSGTSGNNGVYLYSPALESTGSSVTVNAIANAGTTGSSNVGFFTFATNYKASSNVTLTGTGGGGTSFNRGIYFSGGSVLTTTSSVALSGTARTTTTGIYNQGIYSYAAPFDAVSALTITGTGGGGSSLNTGVYLFAPRAIATAGAVTVTGTASTTTTGSSNAGIYTFATNYSASGNVTLVGFGGGGTSFNRGIYLSGGSVLATTGSVTLTGTAQAATTGIYNQGIYSYAAPLDAVTALTIIGTGGGGTSLNTGVYLFAPRAIATGGAVTVTGTARTTTTGSSNAGIFTFATNYSASANVTLTGIGGGGTSFNRGIYLSGGSVIATTGSVTLTGTAQATTTGAYNQGIYSYAASFDAVSGLNLTGTGGGGTSLNTGVYLFAPRAIATGGAVNVMGTARTTTNGSSNAGIFTFGTRYDGDSVVLDGKAGTGTSSNRGLYVSGGSITANVGNIDLDGLAQAGNSSSSNAGVFVSAVPLFANEKIFIDGTGGGGTSANYGVYLNSPSVETDGSSIVINGFANANTTGSSNVGVQIVGSRIFADHDLSIVGIAGGGTSYNTGLSISGGSVSAGNTLDLIGRGAATGMTTGILNRGIYIYAVTLYGQDAVLIDGEGGNGTSFNYGVYLFAPQVTTDPSGSEISVNGLAQAGTTGSSNSGIYTFGSHFSGVEVEFVGTGGGGTSFNRGIYVSGGSITSTVDDVDLDGSVAGTTTGSSNSGVALFGVPIISNRDLTIDGTGGGGTSYNLGVDFSSPKALAPNGAITIKGTANGMTSGIYNIGVQVVNATTESDGNLRIEGTGGGGTSISQGIRLVGGATTSLTGSLNLFGQADAMTTGSTNTGVFLLLADLKGDFKVSVEGTSGGGLSSNIGVYVASSKIENTGPNVGNGTTNTVTIVGNSNANLAGTLNRGVALLSSQVLAVEDIRISSVGGNGVNSNEGFYSLSSRIESTLWRVFVDGQALGSTTGSSNSGVHLIGTQVLAPLDAIQITGTGGGGTSNNQGVRIIGGKVESSFFDQSSFINGTAQASTTGTFNTGVYIFGFASINDIGSSFLINGTGGGLTGGGDFNHGIYMHFGINAPNVITIGVAGGGANSENEAGNFFP